MIREKTKKTKNDSFRKTGLLSCILLSSLFLIRQIGAYQNPDLMGEWISKETGRCVTFLENGQVLLEDKNYIPTYVITKPNEMIYTIEDKTFLMEYSLEKRELSWGIKGQDRELFQRK